MAEQITVLIKAANQSIPDLKIECQSDWTVLQLKEKIFQLHPITPNVTEQRLIYSGHLLQDSFALKTVLRHPSENNVHIVHLVCSTSKVLPERKPVVPSLSQSQSQTNPPVAPPPVQLAPAANPSHAGSPDTSGVRRRNVASVDGGTSFSTQQPFVDPASIQPYISQFPTLSTMGDPVQQMIAVQQMYAQYMASYMQYMQGGSLGTFMVPQDVAQPATTTPSLSASSFMPPALSNDASPEQRLHQQQVLEQPPNEQQNVPNDGIQQPQPNAQEPRLNVQAGGGLGEEDEEGFARDWLDYIYFGCRMLFLLCIVYFYSTLRRFIFVISTSVLIYLYQVGWFRPARQDAEADPAAAQEADGGAPAPANDEGEPPAEREQQQQQPAPPPPSSTSLPAGGGGEEEEIRRVRGSSSNTPTDDPRLPSSSSSSSPTPTPSTTGDEAAGEGSGDPPAGSASPTLPPAASAAGGSQSSAGLGLDQTDAVEGLALRPSYLWLAWTFVSSFFISLIPDRQQEII